MYVHHGWLFVAKAIIVVIVLSEVVILPTFFVAHIPPGLDSVLGALIPMNRKMCYWMSCPSLGVIGLCL